MRKAQTVIEYVLIAALVAIISATCASKMNLKSIKNYVFDRPSDTTTPSQINIEAMTK